MSREAAKANFAAGEARRETFLQLVVARGSQKAARAELGVTEAAVTAWRRRYPEFRRQLDAVRSEIASTKDTWDGTFPSFRQRFMHLDSYYHHLEIDHAINTAPRMGVTWVLVPPEHGKSTVLADKICEQVGQNANVRVTVVSEGQGLARKMVGRVQRRMTNIDSFGEYIARFGPFIDDQVRFPWTADYMRVAKAQLDEQDYTLEARGWTSSIAGSRSDYMYLDDIQSLKSLGQTNLIVDRVRQDFISRLGRESRLVGVGTRVGLGDVHEKLQDEGIIDRLVQLPATKVGVLVDCPEGDECEIPHIAHEQPLCPQMWDTHSLAMKRKQVGEVVWWRTYQQQPRQAGDATFSEAMCEKAKNPLRGLGLDATLPDFRILSLDPALGGGNALTCWAADERRLALVDLSRRFGLSRTEEILDEIGVFASRYRPRVLVVEAVAFQRGLANDDRLRELGRQYGFRIVPHMTGMNKLDEAMGVASMDTSFTTLEIDLPYADEFTKAKVDLLVGELQSWRPNVPTRKIRQDLVMSMWFAWLEWMRLRATLTAGDERTWGRKGLPGYTARPSGLLVGGTR